MIISGIPLERTNQSSEGKLVLRDGQVALGKVTKIYPNNRAEVQIGAHRIVAQIDTPLAVGERYIFQVDQKSEQLVHLRVLGTYNPEMNEASIRALLQQLQIRITDSAVQFVKSLVNERIPFNRTELSQALQLLNSLSKLENAPSIIKEMLQKRIPLSENIARALLSYRNGQFSSTMEKALQQVGTLPSSPNATRLQSTLSSLIQSPLTQGLQNLAPREGQQLLQTLQLFRLNIDINDEVNPSGSRGVTSDFSRRININERLLSLLSYLVERPEVRTSILNLIENYTSLKRVATSLGYDFELTSRSSLTKREYTVLQQRISSDLLPLLPKQLQESIRPLLQTNTENSFNQLRALIQSLANNHLYTLLLESVLNHEARTERNDTLLPQQFLLHAKQVLQSLGVANEYMLRHTTSQAEQVPLQIPMINETIKALLLNIVQEERTPLENVQQLVHYINGLQLQTREENSLLYAQLQLPGEKIGLPTDLFLQFEGKKTDNDEIDTSFCRILFFLHLHHIKDTVIDMHVQKRVITLTVYNDYYNPLAKMMEPFRQRLAEGLDRIDYRLSNVRFKPLDERGKSFNNEQKASPVVTTRQEGFDIRI